MVYYGIGITRSIYNSKDNPVKFYAFDFHYLFPCYDENWTAVDVPIPFETVEAIRDQALFSRLAGLFKHFVNVWTSEKLNHSIKNRTGVSIGDNQKFTDMNYGMNI